MQRYIRHVVYMTLLWAGLFSCAHAEFNFNPRDNPDGLNCLFHAFLPPTGADEAVILREAWFTPAQIAKAHKVFAFYEAEYRVEGVRIYMPCKYYSDMSFLLGMSTALFSPGDDYPEITITKF